MKKIMFFLLFVIPICGFTQNLTSQEILGLANKQTVEGITTLLQNKGYYLDTKNKFKGQYYGTDEVIYLVYCFNCDYYELYDKQNLSYDGSFTCVTIYYNITKSKIEDISVWFSNRNTFLQLRKILANYGYKYIGEDLTSSEEGIIYKYKNPSKKISINVKEKTDGDFIAYIIK